MADNKVTFFGKCNGIAVEQLIRYGKFNMNVKHFHNQYELFYIIEGERQFFFDNKSYNAHAGDLAIIDTNLVHTTCSITSEDKGYNRVIMYIDYGRASRVFGTEDSAPLRTYTRNCMRMFNHVWRKYNTMVYIILMKTYV